MMKKFYTQNLISLKASPLFGGFDDGFFLSDFAFGLDGLFINRQHATEYGALEAERFRSIAPRTACRIARIAA